MRLKKIDKKILKLVYECTDCSNGVYDWALLHPAQNKVADRLVRRKALKKSVCVKVDGDGIIGPNERWGIGYRLTDAGYEALTEMNPGTYPIGLRRFASKRDDQ